MASVVARVRILAGAVGLALNTVGASAGVAAHPSVAQRSVNCLTSVTFGEPSLRERGLVFRGTVSVACPPGVAFSATFRSANACRLRSPAGSLPYELFADPAMQLAVVSCERSVEPLRGVGRQLFVLYGRVSGAHDSSGRFSDALLATVTT